MGLIAGYLAFKGEASQPWRLFVMTGILGGYTTFSAFSLDAALLYERGELGLAALYVLGSVALSIAGLFGGLAGGFAGGLLFDPVGWIFADVAGIGGGPSRLIGTMLVGGCSGLGVGLVAGGDDDVGDA